MSKSREEIKASFAAKQADVLRVLRNRLVTGIILALPMVATVAAVTWFINRVDTAVLNILPGFAEPQAILGYEIPGFGFVVAIILLILLGSFARNIFGKQLIRSLEATLLRLPVISSIYNFIKQIVSVFSQNNERAFKEVCLIEYPRPGLWAVGFITTDLKGAPADHLTDGYACVFVPTTPNPTSGFLLFCKRTELQILDMTAEEGAKLIISGGMVSSNEELSDISEEIPGLEPDPSRPGEVRRHAPARKGKVKAVPPDPVESATQDP